MKEWKSKLQIVASLFPAAVLMVCIGISLSSYTKPVFQVQALKENEATEETSAEKETANDKNKTVKLPSTADGSETAVKAAKAVEKTTDASAYKNGVYDGIGTGFGGQLRVRVTIEKGKIQKIEVMETKDGTAYMAKAKALLDNMIKKQSTNVDVVSGATYSSVGLIEAVRDALKDAGAEEEDDNDNKDNKNNKNNEDKVVKAVQTVKKITDASAYKNGVYDGIGTGFGGQLRVRVTIKNEKIYKIEVVETKDGAAYVKKAKTLLQDIVKKQSTNVDVVSGATYSSAGLIEAVRDALKDAAKSEKDKTNDKKEEEKNKENQIKEGKFPYKNGVYYGTGEGYRGEITVAVSICDKTLRYILITEASDDKAFLSKAKTLLDTVVKKQSTKVDVVSGATYSSNGIIEAIKNALADAKKITNGVASKPEEETTEEELPKDQTPEETETEAEDSGAAIYTDGEYTADVICSPDANWDFEAYTLSLKISVKDDKVISVTDVKGSGKKYDIGNDWYIARAVNGTSKYPGIAKQITTKGKPEEIDVVSGATCSSKAVIEAVRKALENAKTAKQSTLHN